MKHRANLQHYALNKQGSLIDIDNIDEGTEYFCPCCKRPMTPKRGQIRQWHFAHHIGNEPCDYDKYLHSLAELKIKEWFNNAEHIYIKLKTFAKCQYYDKCPMHEDDFCKAPVAPEPIDLKTYYGQCTEEVKLEKDGNVLIPDLLAVTEKGHWLFFEILVTHKCDDVKLKSGVRIIEIPITSEDDIERITNSDTLIEDQDASFFNFKHKDIDAPELARPMQKFIIHKSGKAFIDREHFCCKDFKKQRRGVFEMTLPYYEDIPLFFNCGGIYPVGWAKAAEAGIQFKNCALCKYMHFNDWEGISSCALYRKFGTNKDCRQNNATTCQYYREDFEQKTYCLKELAEYQAKEYVNIWHI